jgi:hypothetical protein
MSGNGSNTNKGAPSIDLGTIMIGSDFWTSSRRDSLDSQADTSRRSSMDGGASSSSPSSSSPSSPQRQQQQQLRQKQQQQQRGRFWGAAQVDCTAAPFSA